MGQQRVTRFTPDGEAVGSFSVSMAEGIPVKWMEAPDGDLIQQAMIMAMPGMQNVEPKNLLLRREPDGTISVYDKSIDRKGPHDMVHLGLARTFQNINLFGEQTTLDNILIGGHALVGNPWSAMPWLPTARQRERALLKRAEEIADMCVYLASEKGSYITGQTIPINGGMVFV